MIKVGEIVSCQWHVFAYFVGEIFLLQFLPYLFIAVMHKYKLQIEKLRWKSFEILIRTPLVGPVCYAVTT